MFRIYTKHALLVLLLFALSSCSFFKSNINVKTKSIDDLLKEDIQVANKDFENEESEDANLEFDENLSSSNSLNKNTQAKKNTEANTDTESELSLDDEEDIVSDTNNDTNNDINGNTNANNDIVANTADTESELSLDDEENIVSDINSDTNSDTEDKLNLDDTDASENLAQAPNNLTSPKNQATNNFVNLTDIKYTQEKGSEVLSIVSEQKVKYKTQFNKQNNQLIISIKNAKLSRQLTKPYFVKNFLGNAIVAVNSYQDPQSKEVNIVLQLRNGTTSVPSIVSKTSGLKISYKLDSKNIAFKNSNPENTLVNTKIKTKIHTTTLSDFFLGRGNYYGHSISLQFENVDTKKVIAYIASEVGANILIDDSIQGTVSLKLRNIPWDQALALILKSKSLGYIKEKGGILRIASLEKLKKEEEALVAILKSKKSLTPLSVKVIPISFAKASDLASKLKAFLTPKRGALSADSRSNTLIVTDTPKVLKKISLLVKNLDKAPNQVSIEAKFIEANQSFSKNLGVNWGFTGGKIDINGLQGSSGPVSVGLESGGIKPVSPNNLKGLTGSIGLTLGSFKFLGDLSSILAIAEQDQVAKVISTPTVVVLDKQKASITNQGENLSIDRTENNGVITESIKRTPIKLQLDVSPQIAADGNILLDVNIIREFAGGAISTGSSARPINSRTVKSKVLIKNGDTLVIGGIFQKDTSQGRSGVPVLSKLPFVGWLFRYESDTEDKNELMVFLTPKIL